MRKRRALLSVTVSLVVLLPACCAAAVATAAAAAAWCEGASRFSSGPRSAPLLRCGGVHCSGERQAHLALRGGGNSLGSNGEAITEEQAGEELIKAATANNIAGLDPAGLNLLIQSGAPVNYQDMWKRTPLHYAAREGQAEACQRLVELGADLTAQDFLGRTPLHLAARKGHADVVVLLANLGSDVNHADKNPWPNNSGRTPMHWACYKGHAEVVLRLCELGADKEALDAMRRTPLHWAARRGQTSCVQVLLLEGANLHAVDSKAMKPVNLANSKESNSATQVMLHKATVKQILPTHLPEFPPQPVPAVNMNALIDTTAQLSAQLPARADVTAKPSSVPLKTAVAPRGQERAKAVAAASVAAASVAAAACAEDEEPPAVGFSSLEEAVAKARAQYEGQTAGAGGFGGNRGGAEPARGVGSKLKTGGDEDDGFRFVREPYGVEDSEAGVEQQDVIESEEIDFA